MQEVNWVINQIVVQDSTNQRITTKMRNVEVTIHLKYNTYFDHWVFDFYLGRQRVITGKNMVLDYDLLRGYRLGIGHLVLTNLPSVRVRQEPNRANLVNGDIRMVALWKEVVNA